MKNFLTCFLFLAILVFITGCDRDGKAWEKAKNQNTKQAHAKYLKKNPDGQFITQAKKAIEEIDWRRVCEEASEEHSRKQ